MKKNFTLNEVVLIIISCILFGFLFGLNIAGEIIRNKNEETEKTAIEKNAAYYHPQTAKFTWRDDIIPRKNEIDEK